MKITSKVVLGYGMMIAIIIAVHLHQTSLMQEMLGEQRQLTEVGFGTGLRAHRVQENLTELEDSSLKYLATGDTFYLENTASLRSRIGDDLHEMLRVNLFAGPLGNATREVVARWGECSTQLDQLQAARAAGEELGGKFQTQFDPVFDALKRLIRAGEDYLTETAERTRKTGERVTSVSRIALPVALALSAAVTLLVFQSISFPLKDMLRGARRIAQGDFEVRLQQDRGDELSTLAVALNGMARRLGELDRLKRDFVSHVSHDLRAPLASVEETTRLLLDEFSEGLDSTQRRLLELSLSSSRRLSRLIGNLLDLSRIEAGVIAFEFRVIGLDSVIAECVENLQGLFFEKQLNVVVDPCPEKCTVLADRVRLVRVIENLLSNAIDFSPARGEIRVTIERGRRPSGGTAHFAPASEGPLCCVSISDQGPGVASSERNRIFDQFYTAGRTDSGWKKGGTGLGLTIAGKVVEAHEGEIWVEDNPAGKGSRFCVLLGFRPGNEGEGRTLPIA